MRALLLDLCGRSDAVEVPAWRDEKLIQLRGVRKELRKE
jgi:hypothetical protein